jgi:hypothetical protein
MAKIIATTHVETTYKIEITQKELDVIVALTGSIFGDSPARSVTDEIYYSLKDVSSGYDSMDIIDRGAKMCVDFNFSRNSSN